MELKTSHQKVKFWVCYFLLVLLPLISSRKLHKGKHHKHRIIVSKPCKNCDILNNMQGDQPRMDDELERRPSICNNLCQPCPQISGSRDCKAGVTFTKDGCGCCNMCARQQGDLCDEKDKCDPAKKMFCDFEQKGEEGKGICRAIKAKDCEHKGKTYKDGTFFSLNCSEYCSCQNGQVTCSSVCPHEQRPPSSLHCKEPRLVPIKGRCCKEWVCPHSFSLMDSDYPFPAPSPTREPCKIESTPWSSCSKTCGVGVSVRHTNDNERCQPIQQRRLCLVRPCEFNDKHLMHLKHSCPRTWDIDDKRTIKTPDRKCESIKEYQLKFCSTCKYKKCCGPGDTKTRDIMFKCTDGTIESKSFMWIKNCKCIRKSRCPF